MKKFRCGDVVPGCAAEFRGTREQIFDQAAMHAAAHHGGTIPMSGDTAVLLEAAIEDVFDGNEAVGM
ncbi:DUF1059 domain-containing protein [Solicola sp. PLA-1-18]|uniref:DUF1059 domain-containing protein n=1 Tax=Solicola sp. PLA-1-18 TaxID=3380532 RepID=UPI003B827F2C